LEVSVYRADPVTWLDIFAAFSPFLGALIAIGGVIVTIIYTNRRERDRQEHERLLKAAELEAQRESRFRDERIAAYRKLIAATTTAHVDRAGVDALVAAQAEISLLASTDEIDQAAAEVKLAYWQKQRISYRETQNLDTPATESAQALRKAEAARDRFLALAWEELGIKGRSAGFRDLEGSNPGKELPGPETPSS
jgi:FtsZ-interacting cell division protein ZipA